MDGKIIIKLIMKRILLTLIALFAALCLFGQTDTGSFSALKDQSNAQLVVDFSEASIHGMSEEDFADYEQDWYKDKPEIIAIITNNCNEKLRGLTLGRREAPYILRLKVLSVSARGDFDCDAYLEDPDGNVLGTIEGLWGKGGRFGTKLNLIKDGAERLGQCLGIALRYAIRKQPKTYNI